MVGGSDASQAPPLVAKRVAQKKAETERFLPSVSKAVLRLADPWYCSVSRCQRTGRCNDFKRTRKRLPWGKNEIIGVPEGDVRWPGWLDASFCQSASPSLCSMLRASSPPPEGAWHLTQRNKALLPPPSGRLLLTLGLMVAVASMARRGSAAATMPFAAGGLPLGHPTAPAHALCTSSAPARASASPPCSSLHTGST